MIDQGLPDPLEGPGPEDLPTHSDERDSGDAPGSVGFGAGVETGDSGTAARRKKPRSRKKKASPPKGGAAPSGEDPPRDDDEPRETAEGGTKKRRRRSRRKKSGGESDEPPAERDADAEDRPKRAATKREEPASEDGDGDDDAAAKKRRRRGSRGGRRRKKSKGVAVDSIPGEEDDLPELPDLPEEAELLEPDADRSGGGRKKARKAKTAKKKGAKKKARKSSTRSSDDDDDGGERKKRKRSRSKKKVKDEPESDAPTPPTKVVERTQRILVNACEPEEKRVAVVASDNRIIDLLMTAESQKTLVNDIYRGKVVNLEPAIGAAFVDFGQGRNGFLHTSDVLPIYGEKGFKLDQLLTASVDPEEWDEGERSEETSDVDDAGDDDEAADKAKEKAKDKAKEKKGRGQSGQRRRGRQRLPISDLLRVGDQVVVQITKDAIGDKGPTLTTFISIPGRYLVLMPSMARTGVSRKIPDDKERRRLKRILASLKAPTDMGVIVRTAGIGKTKTDLQRDLDYLLGVWETFGKRLKHGRGPMPLYQESDVAHRTLRDLFNARTAEVVVDDPMVYEQLIEFSQKLMPEQEERIKQHDGDRPLFHHFGIEQDFEKVFARRVELPSGGSIVFDQAEALVAIDVNSGRTRTESFDFEEIALKTNLEAVPEIARQIRLRDLGGILVCDFIDMMKSSSNRAVERALRTELADDRARSKLGRISQFGLLEMTRQRLGPGTHKKVFQTCPRCRGTGRVRSIESRAQAILRRLGSAMTQKGFSEIDVRAHPEVIEYLKENLWDYVRALEHRFERELRFTEVPEQTEDSVLRYLRTDGREVRPGGRRKR